MQGDSPCPAACGWARWRAWPTAWTRCAARCARNCRWARTRSRSGVRRRGLAYRSGRRLGLFRGRDPRHRRRGARPPDLCAGPRLHRRGDLARGALRRAHHRARQPGRRRGGAADGRAGRLCGAHADHLRGPGQRGSGPGLPADSVAKVAQVRNAGLHSLEIYRDAGVPMGFGTDLLGPSHRLQSENSACAPRCWARRR